MALQIELLRPDDLLNLRIEAVNLRVDADDPDDPALVVENPEQAAYVRFLFPPQTIAERAYFEFSIVEPENDPDRPDPDADETGNEPLDPPGQTPARIGRPSRIVFTVPPEARLPLSTEGLLDWSGLALNVHPIAAIGPDPTKEQIAQAPAISEPTPEQTALELPYRLVISPNRDVAWAHRTTPFTARGRTELWHTRLQSSTPDGPVDLSRSRRAPLRAIWSPDYNTLKRPGTSATDPHLDRTAMSPDDRYQIVILTSAFHGYESDIEVKLGGIGNGPIGGVVSPGHFFLSPVPFKTTVPYVPKPFEAEQLMLSPLGGWLRSRGAWDPPRTAQPDFSPHFDFKDYFTRLSDIPPGTLLDYNRLAEEIVFPPRRFLTEQLDLSEWVHVATQGRDHYVRIVYEGELWPFHNRAALIKVTERKFMEHNGIIGAYLMQRMFIVVREPEKTFTDRSNPFQRVRLTTLITPDLAVPDKIAGTNRSFWVEVMTSATTPELFRFHAVGWDAAGDPVDFTVPMLFVSISDVANNAGELTHVSQEYNAAANIERRDIRVPGQKIAFAERDVAAPNDNTRLVTETINFLVDAENNPPVMLKAAVKIPQVQELLGTDAATTIRYYPDYVGGGFDAKTGVFAEIAKLDLSAYANDPFAAAVPDTLGVDFSSDQAGGFATPNLGVSTLTRALGPLAGTAADAVNDAFNPGSFFGEGLAMLFGSFDLSKLLIPETLGTNAPKLRTSQENGTRVATLDWEPVVQNLQIPPSGFAVARFQKDHNGSTQLTVHGRIEKPVAPAGDATFEFTGTLNHFRIGVLEAVFINFVEFHFEARTNQKPDVRVKLDPATPMEFAGDLRFIEELRKAIPPDLFGDGPSLDLTPTGIRAGFSFALPPLAVGVFALKDVNLGAALTLPFLDGKPVFDFNVSERVRPFLLQVGIFGGGGFFRLQIDTAGIKMVEAAFEFGATASLDIGVASGEVHMMAGIYFSLQRNESSNELAPLLSGYLRLGGSLSVLGLVKISVEFNLSFTYDGVQDKAYGRATLTVEVEVAFFSKSVELTVERGFGGQSGDPTFGEFFITSESWNEYALAFA